MEYSSENVEGIIYEYLLMRRDRLDLYSLLYKEQDLEEKESLEAEIAEIEEKIKEAENFIDSTEESYEMLLKIEKELNSHGGIRSFKLDEMYMDFQEREEKGLIRKNITSVKTATLTDKFIKQDKENLGLEQCQIYTVKKEELENKLDNELANYNADILYANESKIDITIMEGIDKEGNKKVLYYYPHESYKDRTLSDVIRQIRTFNKNGDIISMTRGLLNSNGEYSELDAGSVVYQYDKNGNKKVGLYQDDLIGPEYFEYDEDGNIKLSISEEAVRQRIKDGEKEYFISDGYFKPTNNGYQLLPSKSMYDIEPTDIKRYVFGNISEQERESILNDLSAQRQEQILSILRIMEPIFEYSCTYNKLETEEREKIITWFKGFSKELKIDSRINSTRSTKDEQLRGRIEESRQLDNQIGQAEDLLAQYSEQISNEGTIKTVPEDK